MRKAFSTLAIILFSIVIVGYLTCENYGTNVDVNAQEPFELNDISTEVDYENTFIDSNGNGVVTLNVKNNGNVTSPDLYCSLDSSNPSVSLNTPGVSTTSKQNNQQNIGKIPSNGSKSLAWTISGMISGTAGEPPTYSLIFTIQSNGQTINQPVTIEGNELKKADLGVVSVTSSKSEVKVGDSVDVNVKVKNMGPDKATGVSISANEYNSNVGNITSGKGSERTFTLKAPNATSFNVTGGVSGKEIDEEDSNNNKSITLKVTGVDLAFPSFATLLIVAGFIMAKRDIKKRK